MRHSYHQSRVAATWGLLLVAVLAAVSLSQASAAKSLLESHARHHPLIATPPGPKQDALLKKMHEQYQTLVEVKEKARATAEAEFEVQNSYMYGWYGMAAKEWPSSDDGSEAGANPVTRFHAGPGEYLFSPLVETPDALPTTALARVLGDDGGCHLRFAEPFREVFCGRIFEVEKRAGEKAPAALAALCAKPHNEWTTTEKEGLLESSGEIFQFLDKNEEEWEKQIYSLNKRNPSDKPTRWRFPIDSTLIKGSEWDGVCTCPDLEGGSGEPCTEHEIKTLGRKEVARQPTLFIDSKCPLCKNGPGSVIVDDEVEDNNGVLPVEIQRLEGCMACDGYTDWYEEDRECFTKHYDADPKFMCSDNPKEETAESPTLGVFTATKKATWCSNIPFEKFLGHDGIGSDDRWFAMCAPTTSLAMGFYGDRGQHMYKWGVPAPNREEYIARHAANLRRHGRNDHSEMFIGSLLNKGRDDTPKLQPQYLSSPAHPDNYIDFSIGTSVGVMGGRVPEYSLGTILDDLTFDGTGVVTNEGIVEAWRDRYNEIDIDMMSQLCKGKGQEYIPKNLHSIWLGKPMPSGGAKMQESWVQYHQEWRFLMWTDAWVPSYKIESGYYPAWMRKALIKRFGRESVPHLGVEMTRVILTYPNVEVMNVNILKEDPDWYDEQDPEGMYSAIAKNFATRADSIRHFILWKYGGFYVDNDAESFRSLNPLLCYSAVGAMYPNDDVMTIVDVPLLGFSKNNPIPGATVAALKLPRTSFPAVFGDDGTKEATAMEIASWITGPPVVTILFTRMIALSQYGADNEQYLDKSELTVKSYAGAKPSAKLQKLLSQGAAAQENGDDDIAEPAANVKMESGDGSSAAQSEEEFLQGADVVVEDSENSADDAAAEVEFATEEPADSLVEPDDAWSAEVEAEPTESLPKEAYLTVVLPTSFFFPKFHRQDKLDKEHWLKPESFCVHYWWGSWKGAGQKKLAKMSDGLTNIIPEAMKKWGQKARNSLAERKKALAEAEAVLIPQEEPTMAVEDPVSPRSPKRKLPDVEGPLDSQRRRGAAENVRGDEDVAISDALAIGK